METTMTGLISKIARNISGAVNDLVENTANTGREARQLVRDLGDKIAATEQAYIDVKANVVLLTNNRDSAQAESDKWQENAKKALKKNEEALARQCLEKKQEYDAKVKGCQNQIDAMKPQVELLDSQLEALRAKHDEMSNTTDLLEARSETAKAQQKASTILSGIASDDVTSEFERLDKKVSKDEARAKVMLEASDQRSGKALADSVAALDKKESVDEELAKLKEAL
jgi:phage shock protein A